MAKPSFLQRLSATTQFLLGFIFGVTFIAGVAVAAGYYYYRKMSLLPPKPVFSQEEASPTNNSATPADIEDTSQSETSELTEAKEVIAEPEPKPEPKPELPPNAYKAKVTWPQGLSLRAQPSRNAGRIGGIAYDATIIILEETADRTWQRVRLPWSEQEGWVKGGNTQRISD